MKFFALLACTAIYVLIFCGAAQDELAKSVTRGKVLYTETCITCHLANGLGVEKTFPPLANSDFLKKYPEKSIHAIKYGMRGPVTVNGVIYDNAMPPSTLDDEEIADVMNYIRNAFGNKNSELILPKTVAAVKEK